MLKRSNASSRKAILIFGESVFDGLALQQIVMAVRPDIATVKVLKRPFTLRRDADVEKHRARADLVCRAVKAAGVATDIIAVVTHRDLDRIEPANNVETISMDELAHRTDLKKLIDLGIKVVATTPAWEMETWWLMWPSQVAQVRPSWRTLKDRSGARVDRIENSKEVLRKELRRTDKPNNPEYSETDAPRIAFFVRKDGVVTSPLGISVAFIRFTNALNSI